MVYVDDSLPGVRDASEASDTEIALADVHVTGALDAATRFLEQRGYGVAHIMLALDGLMPSDEPYSAVKAAPAEEPATVLGLAAWAFETLKTSCDDALGP